MRISFELSERDMRYFRDRLHAVRQAGTRDEATIIRGAIALVEDALATDPPEFVRERLVKLRRLIDILQDREWRLEGRDRARIVDALVYFVDPEDVIPDRIPGLGYLDDAIMVELVTSELEHDIHAYEDFCEFRASGGHDDERLAKRRAALHQRMRRRHQRQRDRQRGAGPSDQSPIRLW